MATRCAAPYCAGPGRAPHAAAGPARGGRPRGGREPPPLSGARAAAGCQGLCAGRACLPPSLGGCRRPAAGGCPPTEGGGESLGFGGSSVAQPGGPSSSRESSPQGMLAGTGAIRLLSTRSSLEPQHNPPQPGTPVSVGNLWQNSTPYACFSSSGASSSW